MTIEESDFKLTSCSEGALLFDLELIKVVNKGKKNERTEFSNAGYGMTLESAIKKVVQNRIDTKHEEAISLKQFLKEYKEETVKIKQICQI